MVVVREVYVANTISPSYPLVKKYGMLMILPCRYADEEAQAAHINTPQCQSLMKVMEQEKLCSDVRVVFTKPEIGVKSYL